MSRTWPAARAFVLGDAGNGVITDEFLQNQLDNWNFDPHVPRFIPALDQPFDRAHVRRPLPGGRGLLPERALRAVHDAPSTAAAAGRRSSTR